MEGNQFQEIRNNTIYLMVPSCRCRALAVLQVQQVWDLAIVECKNKIAAVESAHAAEMAALTAKLADLRARAAACTAASAHLPRLPVRPQWCTARYL